MWHRFVTDCLQLEGTWLLQRNQALAGTGRMKGYETTWPVVQRYRPRKGTAMGF